MSDLNLPASGSGSVTTDPAAKTVVVCGLEPIVVEGVRNLLAKCSDLEFLEATDSLDTAAEILQRAHPSILMLDASLGPHAILDWLEGLKSHRFLDSPVPTGVMIWGVSGNEVEAVHLLRVGARGVLRRGTDIATLLTCLRAVAAGRTWYEDARSSRYLELTSREREVLDLVERGFRNKDIARKLAITEGTAKIHLKHLVAKTGLSRHALALRALRDHIEQSESRDNPVQERID